MAAASTSRQVWRYGYQQTRYACVPHDMSLAASDYIAIPSGAMPTLLTGGELVRYTWGLQLKWQARLSR